MRPVRDQSTEKEIMNHIKKNSIDHQIPNQDLSQGHPPR